MEVEPVWTTDVSPCICRIINGIFRNNYLITKGVTKQNGIVRDYHCF